MLMSLNYTIIIVMQSWLSANWLIELIDIADDFELQGGWLSLMLDYDEFKLIKY